MFSLHSSPSRSYEGTKASGLCIGCFIRGAHKSSKSMDILNEGKPCIDAQTSTNFTKVFEALVAVGFSHCQLHFRPVPQASPTDGSPPTRAKRTCESAM